MTALSFDSLAAYWSAPEVAANLFVFMNLLAALLLGLIVGYERSYRGRAAGMRTYGLVCMASAALIVIIGYPSSWYGGHPAVVATADPTRVIQGIVTGIGFLGAGVIMKEGFFIRGLTTAASIWASSAIGILVGIGFYVAAILLTLLAAVSMLWLSRIETWLPSHHSIAIIIRFNKGFMPNEGVLRRMAQERGYQIAGDSLSVSYQDGQIQWSFIAQTLNKADAVPIAELAGELVKSGVVDDFTLSHERS